MLPDFKNLQQSAVGLEVSDVWRGVGSALFVEFGKLHPTVLPGGEPGAPEGDLTLMIEWSWRVEQGPFIICGSGGAEELWQPSFDKLQGQRILDISTFGRLPEVVVTFTNDLRILSFSIAENEVGWGIIDRRGEKPETFLSVGEMVILESTLPQYC